MTIVTFGTCTHEGELTVTKALGNALSPEQEANSSALVVTRSTGFLLQGPSFETPGVSAYNLINAEYQGVVVSDRHAAATSKGGHGERIDLTVMIQSRPRGTVTAKP